MVGGFHGGHRKANLLLGAVPALRVLCRNAPYESEPLFATTTPWSNGVFDGASCETTVLSDNQPLVER